MMRTLIPLYFFLGEMGGNERCHNKSFCWRTSCNSQNAVWKRHAGSVKSSSTSILQEKFPQSLSRTKGVSTCKDIKSRLLETEKASVASGGIQRLLVQNGNTYRQIQFQTIVFGCCFTGGAGRRIASDLGHSTITSWMGSVSFCKAPRETELAEEPGQLRKNGAVSLASSWTGLPKVASCSAPSPPSDVWPT